MTNPLTRSRPVVVLMNCLKSPMVWLELEVGIDSNKEVRSPMSGTGSRVKSFLPNRPPPHPSQKRPRRSIDANHPRVARGSNSEVSAVLGSPNTT